MGAPGGFESIGGECPERSVNWLLEPGSANNLNGSRYDCSNLIERSPGSPAKAGVQRAKSRYLPEQGTIDQEISPLLLVGRDDSVG